MPCFVFVDSTKKKAKGPTERRRTHPTGRVVRTKMKKMTVRTHSRQSSKAAGQGEEEVVAVGVVMREGHSEVGQHQETNRNCCQSCCECQLLYFLARVKDPAERCC